jgi:pimeloyl-ACP methyl ester carboxylesterase
MQFTTQLSADGVTERHFRLGEVPGVLWSPAAASGPRPLILIGHGGSQHKTAPSVLGRARRFVTAGGFAAAAIDAPGHGDRPKTAADEEFIASIRARMAAGEPVADVLDGHHAALAEQVVPEWRAVLDALLAAGAGGPVGYWGVSLGSMTGIPLAGGEPRIKAAVFGLAGGPALAHAASRLTIPVEFLLQWDDELVPRDRGLALFGAFGSAQKTLHANPGRHREVPAFELDSSVRFFVRHLTGPD